MHSLIQSLITYQQDAKHCAQQGGFNCKLTTAKKGLALVELGVRGVKH